MRRVALAGGYLSILPLFSCRAAHLLLSRMPLRISRIRIVTHRTSLFHLFRIMASSRARSSLPHAQINKLWQNRL